MQKVILYCIHFIALTAFAQPQSIVHYNGQNFEEYKLNVGVTKLLIDQQGYLWAGLENGLTRYDGHEFVYYKENPLDSVGYKGQHVWDIFEDHEGGIWVGTNHGVNYKAPNSNKFFHYHVDVNRILSIVEDQARTIWMTSPRALIKVSEGEITDSTSIKIKLSEEGVYFYKLFITHDQKILVSGNGVYEIQENDKNEITFNTIIKGRYVSNMAETESGTLLMCSDSGYFVQPKGRPIEENQLDRENTEYGQLHIDKAGNFWFAHDWGIVRVKPDENYKPAERSIYRAGNIRSIAEDRSGNLFFAAGNRILKLGWNYNQYKFNSLPDGFHNSYVWNFIEDGDRLWIGSFDGLFRYSQELNQYEIFRGGAGLESLPHTSVYSLLQDRSNALWIATGNGVVKYDDQTNRFLRVPVTGLSHHLCEDKEGLVWFVSNNILYKFDPVKWELSQIDSVDNKLMVANQIFIDSENVLWIVSERTGLHDYWIDKGKLKSRGDVLLQVQNGIGIGRVLQEDNIGQLWVSYTFGVYVLDKKSRQVVRFMNTTNSPLQQDDAFGIVRDQAGNIWLKQPLLGSICINPKTFEAIAYSPSWLYSGLFGERGRQPSCVAMAGKSGKLYTDGHGDFCVFYPDSLRINIIPPQVVLHEFKMNGGIFDYRYTFQSTENNAEFIIGALHFDNPKLNQYAYFLEGFDAVWSQPSSNNEVRYSSLPSGTFKFYLKAANSDGVWSEPKLMATFEILPVWWQTNIAYAFYVILIGGLATAFYRIKLSQRMARAEAQKMKEIDDFKNQFFTNITHEFRTPLTVITGVAEKVEGQSGILIKRNAEQLLALINQILELSKIEANAAKLNPEPVDIIQYLKYLLQSFTSLADEKAIILHFNADADQLNTVLDKTKFTLIIQNLITNAVKFTPKNGAITITLQSKENQFQIEVSDTGVGIDNTELPFIFNRFYQADNQQENFKGTGIGLALTKELVGLMNGSIEVESKKGIGSTFSVTLPIQWQVSKSEMQPIQEDQNVVESIDEKLNILLVEDNEDVAAVIRDILAEKFEVVHAVNGREGVDKAIENIPDIIISDVMMPEMNGLDATQLLKSDTRTSHIPIILLTAKADIDSRLSGLEKGADIYLAKPFHSRELLLHIQNLMRMRDSLRLRYAGEQTPPKESDHPEDKFVAKLQSLLYDHLSDDTFGIDEICREMGVSRTQLHRKLKALTGKSASIYIRDLRLAEGKKLLLQNSSTVAEVAYAIGFSDPNYLSRLYSEKYGHSPIQERKN